MLKKFIITFFLVSSSTLALGQLKDWGSGFRIGEPGGFMVRKYLTNGVNAIEVNIGTYGGIWGTGRSYKDGTFQNIGYSINALYLWHHPTIINPNVHTYYGFGPQYTSRDFYPKNSKVAESNQKAFGGAALGGIEFFPLDAPNLSFFAEIGFYEEIVPNPFFFHIQGGIGVRVNF